MTYTLHATGLRKSFGELPVLTGLDLLVEAGSVFALLGPNGAGKTTTVRILSTLLRADGGTAVVAGHDVAREPGEVRRRISLTGQYAAVDAPLTAEENLVMMGRLRRLGRAAARRRAAELIERFGLGHVRDRRVATFSGGTKRRLDLAMSLVSDPPVVFLDEPTTGLDPRSRRDVWEAVAELRASGTTVMLTTQYLEEADRLADRIAVIDGGRVVAEGTAAELKARVGSETIELRFAAEDELAAAATLLPGAIADRERLTLRVPGDGTAAGVRALLDELAGRDLEPAALDLHRPTLDEVFLTLTEA
jgi:ABC-2 type transport system ATP-binding protein